MSHSFDKYAATAGVVCAIPAATIFGAAFRVLPDQGVVVVGICCFAGFCWAVVKMEMALRGIRKG